MKKNIFVLTSLMLTLGCGCDSFLDETNYSDVTSEGGYYDTEAGLNAVVNACYTPLRFWAGKEDAIGLSETGTDIIAADVWIIIWRHIPSLWMEQILPVLFILTVFMQR